MDVLTLLTLPPDTAVHVRGRFVRCPSCTTNTAQDQAEVLDRIHDDELALGSEIDSKEAQSFWKCPGCDIVLSYRVVVLHG